MGPPPGHQPAFPSAAASQHADPSHTAHGASLQVSPVFFKVSSLFQASSLGSFPPPGVRPSAVRLPATDTGTGRVCRLVYCVTLLQVEIRFIYSYGRVVKKSANGRCDTQATLPLSEQHSHATSTLLHGAILCPRPELILQKQMWKILRIKKNLKRFSGPSAHRKWKN